MNLEEYKAKRMKQVEEDAQRFLDHDEYLCMACGAYGEDKRSLLLRCGYDVKEVIPEAIDLRGTALSDDGYYLRICKNCRANFLDYLSVWWEARNERRDIEKDSDGNDLYLRNLEANIPVRVNGTVKMLTFEEWKVYEAEKAEK